MNTPDYKLIYHIREWVELSESDEKLVLKALDPTTIRKKKDLLVPGEVCRYVWFIVSGAIRSYYVDEKGVEHIFQLSLENNWISDLESFFAQKPANCYIESLEDSTLLRISYERLETLYAEVPKLERYFRILFQRAYINALQRLNATKWNTAEDRYNDMVRENCTILHRVPQTYIASVLGITPESLSRIRKKK